jgi:hypothetical protein
MAIYISCFLFLVLQRQDLTDATNTAKMIYTSSVLYFLVQRQELADAIREARAEYLCTNCTDAKIFSESHNGVSVLVLG